MFLAITSVGWGFNWPVTKFLIGELPPLTLRGLSGVVGALLLAALAILRRQSLYVPREIWPRLLLAAVLNVTLWMVVTGLALVYLPASEAALIAYTMPVWASLARFPASVAAIGTMAVPVIGVVTSALALHEPLGPGQIAALVFAMAGVAMATMS